jgi:hypothetical protein
MRGERERRKSDEKRDVIREERRNHKERERDLLCIDEVAV